jgi:tripartite-type tricarboxylate transporter receptor subunit TctC
MRFVMLLVLVVGGWLAQPVQPAFGQGYPTKPIRFIIPFAPGGSTDIAGRLLAGEMSASLGQQVVVENRAGAAGVVGIDSVARSSPDGYTLGLAGMGPVVLAHVTGGKPPFAIKDLVFVAHAGLVEMLILASPSAPYSTVRQLVDAAKSNPGKIPYGHAGTGSPANLAFELFKAMSGVDMPAISYKGDGPAIADVLGGHILVASTSVASAMPHIKAGKIKAVAVDSPARSPSLPDVPTVAEAGIAGYEAGTFNVVVAPAATPTAIVERLNSVLNEVMKKPSVRERYVQMGMVPVIRTPAQTAEFVARETAKWGKVIKEANIQMQ